MTYKICYWDDISKTQKERNSTPAEDAQRLLDIAAVSVPQTVLMKQARLALLNAGYLSQVDTIINGMPDPDKQVARIQWDYSNTVERMNPLTLAIGNALGLSSTQLDNLFIAANQIP